MCNHSFCILFLFDPLGRVTCGSKNCIFYLDGSIDPLTLVTLFALFFISICLCHNNKNRVVKLCLISRFRFSRSGQHMRPVQENKHMRRCLSLSEFRLSSSSTAIQLSYAHANTRNLNCLMWNEVISNLSQSLLFSLFFSFFFSRKSWGYFSCIILSNQSENRRRVTIQPFRRRHATLCVCVLYNPKYASKTRPIYGPSKGRERSVMGLEAPIIVIVLHWRMTTLSLAFCLEISEICLTCVGRLVARWTVKRNGQQLKCIVDATTATTMTMSYLLPVQLSSLMQHSALPCSSAELSWVEKLRKLLKRKRLAWHDHCAFGGRVEKGGNGGSLKKTRM